MKVAWLFPGQGSQTVGMGRAVAEASSAARARFDAADAALGQPLSKTIFEGPEDELTLTENAQPALLTTSLALLAALEERVPGLPRPACAAGHSLGEYTALAAAGVLRFDDAVRVVRRRGEAMKAASPPGMGTMAAVLGLEAEVLERICAEVASQGDGHVACANYNAPGQIVVAGTTAAIERLRARLADERGAKVMMPKVAGPFHSAIMRPAADELEAALARVELGAFAFPVYANVDAAPNADPARVAPLLVRQLDGAVRWEQLVRRMVDDGVTHALEIGSGKVLTGLGKRIAKDLKMHAVSDLASIDATQAFFAA